MLRKLPVMAACLLLACGSDALAASRPAMMASPAPDAAMVLAMPGLVNGEKEITIGGAEKTIWEGLVLRKTRIKDDGTIVIPPAGVYMTARSGNWRPFDNEPVRIAGKKFYYINQRSVRDVLHDLVFELGQVVPLNPSKSRGWELTSLSAAGDAFFTDNASTAVFKMVKSTGNYYGEAFPVKAGTSYTVSAMSGKFDKDYFEKAGRKRLTEDKQADSFIISSPMSADGRTYVVVDEITPTQVKVREIGTDTCTDAWISPNAPVIAAYAKGDKFTIGSAQITITDVKAESVSISLSEDGKTINKTFGPWNAASKKALYISESTRDNFWLLSPSGKEIVHLNVRNPQGPFMDNKASLVAYSDVFDVQEGNDWPLDNRFRVRPET